MFTGIVAGKGKIVSIEGEDVIRIVINFQDVTTNELQIGASVSIDGVCLTVVEFNSSNVSFDVIPETLTLTTIGNRVPGDFVNLERALRMGDELGGHLLSGHIMDMGVVASRVEGEDYLDLHIECTPKIMKYVQEKGYLAIDGISLTVGELSNTGFDLHLIPETLGVTTIGSKQVGERVNIEVDSMTQTIVSTVERIMEGKK
tara:strand:+ start:9681 stop:10286 length:606 start_codon:yes stop_codon:yes gene_type:complete